MRQKGMMLCTTFPPPHLQVFCCRSFFWGGGEKKRKSNFPALVPLGPRDFVRRVSLSFILLDVSTRSERRRVGGATG